MKVFDNTEFIFGSKHIGFGIKMFLLMALAPKLKAHFVNMFYKASWPSGYQHIHVSEWFQPAKFWIYFHWSMS